jgi:hypothetical protein
MVAGLKNTLENKAPAFLDKRSASYINSSDAKSFYLGTDRWGTPVSFLRAGYETVFGDLMFGLGIPLQFISSVT